MKEKIKKIFYNLWKHKFRYLGYIIISLALICISLYSEEFKRLHPFIQLLLLLVVITLEMYFRGSQARLIEKKKEGEKEEIRNVLVTFIEHAEIYRRKIIKHLNLEEDYLCIAKSSEGLSDIFNKMKDKEMLPFSKVLYELPGSIKPFENMGIYFIPVKNLKKFDSRNIRKWINKHLIPKAQKERDVFLKKVPTKLSKLADKFSYKYVAFMIKKHSIQYDSLNRKFNKGFIQTFIDTESPKKIVKLSNELGEIIKAKEFFLLVEWSAFAKLNETQKKLIEEEKSKLYNLLVESNVLTLSDAANLSNHDLSILLKKAFGAKITKRRAENLARKIIDGASHVLEVLRASGVNI